MAPREGDVDPEASGTVSIEDFKKLETTLTSSIESHDSQMKEMREMLKLFMTSKTTSAYIPVEEDTDDPLKRDPKLVDSKEGNIVGEPKSVVLPPKRKRIIVVLVIYILLPILLFLILVLTIVVTHQSLTLPLLFRGLRK